jgi:hypothetical protein
VIGVSGRHLGSLSIRRELYRARVLNHLPDGKACEIGTCQPSFVGKITKTLSNVCG